jgi:hypothetical protein
MTTENAEGSQNPHPNVAKNATLGWGAGGCHVGFLKSGILVVVAGD